MLRRTRTERREVSVDEEEERCQRERERGAERANRGKPEEQNGKERNSGAIVESRRGSLYARQHSTCQEHAVGYRRERGEEGREKTWELPVPVIAEMAATVRERENLIFLTQRGSTLYGANSRARCSPPPCRKGGARERERESPATGNNKEIDERWGYLAEHSRKQRFR